MTVVEEADAVAFDAAPRFSWRGRAARTDRRVVAGLIGFVVFWFAFPALVGHPLIPDDDLFQNVPLRMLSGDLLASGHLPLWNRWIWSGTPLLGGLNAGALYPGTFLFAALSPVAAWTVNEILAYALCAVGLYLLLREHRLVPLAAAIGSATFTFAGFMPAQLRHFGLVQGMSFVPWMLLGLEHLVGGPDHRVVGADERARWWLAVVASGGMVLLTGEPRAWSNAAIAVGVYLLVLVWQHPEGRRRLLTAVAVAVPVIVALGAVQILPGLHVVDASQRSDPGVAFFTSGSLPPYALAFQVVPYLLGGYGDLHFLPSYAGGRPHLPEISGYVGLLPLVALLTLHWWRRAAPRRLLAWLLMAAVGIVLALGSSVPGGELLQHVPFYGAQRTPARNLALVDLGLAGVVACWVQVLLTEARSRAVVVRSRLEWAIALVPSAIVVALIVPAWIWRSEYQTVFEVPEIHPSLFGRLLAYFCVSIALAAGVAWFVMVRRRLSARHLRWALVAIVVLDLGFALFNQGIGPFSSQALERSSAQTDPIVKMLAPGERIAVYDPERGSTVYATASGRALTFDLTVVHRLPAVQGYGSVVDAFYNAVTGTHDRQTVLPRVLGTSVADELDLRLVLVPKAYLTLSAPPSSGAVAVSVDPALQAVLARPRWEPAGRMGDFLVFVNTQVRGRAWMVERGTKVTPVDGSVVTVKRIDDQDGEVDGITTPKPALFVRSVAYADGWTAHLKSRSGTSNVPVIRHGLFQAVDVPAGATAVTWSYDPPGLRAGLVLTVTATLGLLVLAAALVTRTLRRRRSAHEPNADEGRTSGS